MQNTLDTSGETSGNLRWLTCAWDDDHVRHVIGMFIGCHRPSLTGNWFDLLIAIDVNAIPNLVRQRNSFKIGRAHV